MVTSVKNAALFKAVSTENMPVIHRLVDDMDVSVNARNDDGETSLHIAVAKGLIKPAEILLLHGASPFIGDRGGVTPMQIAATLKPMHDLLRRFANVVDFAAQVNMEITERDVPHEAIAYVFQAGRHVTASTEQIFEEAMQFIASRGLSLSHILAGAMVANAEMGTVAKLAIEHGKTQEEVKDGIAKTRDLFFGISLNPSVLPLILTRVFELDNEQADKKMLRDNIVA